MVVNSSISSSHEHISFSNSTHDSLSSNTITMSSLSDSETASITNCDIKPSDTLSASTDSSKTTPSSPYSFRRRSTQVSNSPPSPLKLKSSLKSCKIEKDLNDVKQTNGLCGNSSLSVKNEALKEALDDSKLECTVQVTDVGIIQSHEKLKVTSKRRSCTPSSFNIKQMFDYKFASAPKPKRSKSRLKAESATIASKKSSQLLDSDSTTHNCKRPRLAHTSLPKLTVSTAIKGNGDIDLPSPISPKPKTAATALHQILQTTPPSKASKRFSRQCQHDQEWCRPNPYLYPWENESQKLSAVARRALYFQTSLSANQTPFISTQPKTNENNSKTKTNQRQSLKNGNSNGSKSRDSTVIQPHLLYEPQYFGYRVTRDGKKEFLVTWELEEDQ